MTDTMTLSIDVDCSRVTAATLALNDLADAAERAAKAVERLNGSLVTIRRVGDIEYTTIDGIPRK